MPGLITTIWAYFGCTNASPEMKKKKMTIILKIKRRSKAQRADKLRNLKRHIAWVSL